MDSMELSLTVDYDAFCLGDCFANASDAMTAIQCQWISHPEPGTKRDVQNYSSATVPRAN